MSFLRNTFMNTYKSRLYPNYWDIVALFLMLGVLMLLAWDAKQMTAPYQLGQFIPISLDPKHLPGYALRTVTRMLIALCCSLLFTFTVATWAAKNKRAEKIIIPLIDICQSIPILGFLSIAIVGFIALFPHSLLGPECAAIFVIFTSQAWNMTLGFYQTVRSVPSDLKEAARAFHLSAWQKFWRIEVPYSMPGLLWNMMMSMSAGWFFVVASEAVSVSNQQILLPGIGSYIAMAIKEANIHAIAYAILTMFFVILIYDQVLFRPLVAWAEKFKSDQVGYETENTSWLVNLFVRTRLLRRLGKYFNVFADVFINASWLRSKPATHHTKWVAKHENVVDGMWNGTLVIMVLTVAGFLGKYLWDNFPLSAVGHVFLLGLITSLRVLAMIVICSLIWVPVGVWIGLRPHVAKVVQPIAQFLAAFPMNLLYPLVVVLIVKYDLNVDIWVTPLMILGVQWYILFNVIAGASVIPKDLLQVADNFNLNLSMRWRKLILPGIFPYYITGAITAIGGAWNASIVAEVVTWGDKTLVAHGLGAYITQYTNNGDFAHIALGIGMMCLMVLTFNRLVWRPLYVLAEERFQMD